MRIGVLSDTHGQVWTTQQAVRMFESLRIDLLIHCGDIGPAEIVGLFSPWPSHFVFGNMDHAVVLREAIDRAGQTCYERFGHLKIDGRSIAFLQRPVGSGVLRTHARCGGVFGRRDLGDQPGSDSANELSFGGGDRHAGAGGHPGAALSRPSPV